MDKQTDRNDGNCWKRIDVPRFTGEKGWYGRADSKGEVGEKARWLKIKLEQSRDRTVNWGEGRHKYGYQ